MRPRLRPRHAFTLLLPCIAAAALVPQAVFPEDARACSKGSSPGAPYRFDAKVEAAAAAPTDVVVVVSTVDYIGLQNSLPAPAGHLETAAGEVVPLRENQLQGAVAQYASTLRSAFVPASPLAPNTPYVAVIENLAQREGTSVVAYERRIPFTTGAGPRPSRAPVVLSEAAPPSIQRVPSKARVCCAPLRCGIAVEECAPRDDITRQVHHLAITPDEPRDARLSVRVTSDRVPDAEDQEAGWDTQAGTRTYATQGYLGKVLHVPLASNEHACVVVVATDLFTGVETLSEPRCLEGPPTLPPRQRACEAVLSLTTCQAPSAELVVAKMACSESPASPSQQAGGGTTGAGGAGSGAEGGCASAPRPSEGSAGAGAFGLLVLVVPRLARRGGRARAR